MKGKDKEVEDGLAEQANDAKEDPWLAFLPFISEEMAQLIFRSFLRRSASILSTLDFSLPCIPSCDISPSPAAKLLTISKGLLKMSDNTSVETPKCSLLGTVANESEFVHGVVMLTCKVIEQDDDKNDTATQDLPDISLLRWQAPVIGFLGVITWALEVCDNLRDYIMKQGLLAKLTNQFRQISVEKLHTFSKEETTTRIVYLSMSIAFHCIVHSSACVQAAYLKQGFLELLQLILHVPDVEVRLITRSLLSLASGFKAFWDNKLNPLLVMKDDEVAVLIAMLSHPELSVPYSYHTLSFRKLFKMMKCLIKTAENAALLIEWAIPALLAPLSDRLTSEGDSNELAELVWELMLYESNGSVTSATSPDIKSELEHMDFSDFSYDELACQTLPKSAPLASSAIELTELFLQYLTKTLLVYEGIPLEDGLELPEATWFNICECILLMSLILSESDDSVKAHIVDAAYRIPGCCKAMQLAFQIGLTIKDEGLPYLLMKAARSEIRNILVTWSDLNNKLAQEMARCGFVQMFTLDLHVGLSLKSVSKENLSTILTSLVLLLNISYDQSNYPAFFFAETVDQLIPYVGVDNFDISSTAKFVLSCLHKFLDCDQLLALRLTEKEAEYCVSTLKNAINSTDFKGGGFSARELFQILDNFTHPSLAFPVINPLSLSPPKKENANAIFDQKIIEATNILSGTNTSSLGQSEIISLLHYIILKKEAFQAQACKLLWNLLHHDSFKLKVLTDFPGLCTAIEQAALTSPAGDHLVYHCCLWSLNKANEKDFEGRMKYAEGCYKFENYSEAAVECAGIIAGMESDSILQCKAKLLRGKALFFTYQRKLMYMMEKKPILDRAEERKLMSECFESMKEVISLLGTALDGLYLDQEGSRLLDWSMMDCIRETNQLNVCKRCLLCRQHTQAMCKSHIFPKFQLSQKQKESDRSKLFVFGLSKQQIKSARECWLWVCCRRCEAIMSQNAENEFSLKFPSSGTVEYSSWLFNYCCAILFRTLSCVKFPRTFNDDEVYEAFLSSRRHLLSLPVKVGATDEEAATIIQDYQAQLISEVVTKEIQPFLFIIPKTESMGPVFIPWLAPHRLVDGKYDMSGNSHFFIAYCDGITILLQFGPSAKCVLPESCCVFPDKGTYSIPEPNKAIELLPEGVWMFQCRSALKTQQDLTEVLQQLPPHVAKKMITHPGGALGDLAQKLDQLHLSDNLGQGKVSELLTKADTTGDGVQPVTTSNKPHLSMLPPDFKIVKPIPKTMIRRVIKLPQGHQLILHTVEEGLTLFLAIDDSGKPYVIYVFENPQIVYVDGAFIIEVNNEVLIQAFLSDHSLYANMRAHLKTLQENIEALLVPFLLKHSFYSLEMLLEFHKCRQSVRVAKDLLPLGTKCSSEGCWYCSDLCQCCLKPAHLVIARDTSASSHYRFCSEKCKGMFCINPSLMPTSMFVVDHREEYLEGKFKGPSVLDIVQMSRDVEDNYNKIDFFSLCLKPVGGDSKTPPQSRLYVLWQTCHIDHQFCISFSVTESLTPLKFLWFHLLDETDTIREVIQNLKPRLLQLIETSIKSLGCENITIYLDIFKDF